ncbi:RNA polymerase, sigma-24 subunit, ECF subfamily [Sphingopyxis sp. LC81]|nr:RNA polymerase, sigma-24 subunit, ECF subfamily [Sphingopyxis sp. LC81]
MEERARQELLACLKGIRRFAYALTGSMADADDLMQATVLRILERPMPADADVRRWSYRICRNLWIDMRRANRVRSEWSALQSEIGETVVDGQHLADVAVSFQEVDMAMRDLPEAQRALLILVAIEGLSYQEAAELLDIPMGTVMSRLSRARASLAVQFSANPVDRFPGQGKESAHADR